MAALADLTGLPEAVLDIVTASLPGHSHRWALLSSCRAGRDAVLRSIDTISLNYRQQAGQQKHKLKRSGPMGRFLHRACQLARPGLHVKLDNSADILKELLRPALDSTQPNANVHDLELSTMRYTHALQLVPRAFPCLHSLHLTDVNLGPGELLSALHQCSQLTSLSLTACYVAPEVVHAGAAALAQLPSLTQLTLRCTSLDLAEHLTGLTSLAYDLAEQDSDGAAVFADDDSMIESQIEWEYLSLITARNPGLKFLCVADAELDDAVARLEACHLEQLLQSCPRLTELRVGNNVIGQLGLDVLLQYGAHLTSLTVAYFETTESRAGAQWAIQRLHIIDDEVPNVSQLAHLPLSTVHHLVLEGSSLSELELPEATQPAHLVSLLREAATNLAGCPAWQSAKLASLTVWSHTRPLGTPTRAQGQQLLEALSPLGGPHLRSFNLNISEFKLQLGQPEVQVLRASLGHTVQQLALRYCTLLLDAWAALDAGLPRLRELGLGYGTKCRPLGLAVFCSKRDPSRRFVLSLNGSLYEACKGSELQDSLHQQGLQNVTVRNCTAC